MSHTLNAPHPPRRTPRPLGYAAVILAALSPMLLVSLGMPGAGEDTGKPAAMEGLVGQPAVAWTPPGLAKHGTAALMAQVDHEFGRLGAFDPLDHAGEPGAVGEELAVINQWAVLVEEATALDLAPDQRRRVLEFRRQVIAGQKRFLPALRSQFGPAVQGKVAGHDVAVSTSEADHTTIGFLGGMFGSAGYQQGFTETLWPVLRQLRFKRIEYREHRFRDTAASWNILTPEDDALVVWERDAAGYRTVE